MSGVAMMEDESVHYNETSFSEYGLNITPITSNWTTSPAPESSLPMYSSPVTVFATLITFSICTIFGNLLVMLAVSREYYLKSPPNYFIASLAAADFCVGVLIVPFEAISQLLNRRWIFGEIWCDVWHSFDVLLTTASILHLCVIALDRYWAICTPMHYHLRMTSNRAKRFIALVWICSAVISLPAIFWWRLVRTEPVQPGECPFTEDVSYIIFSSCISFYIPLSVMLFAYFKVYREAAQQSKSIQEGKKRFLKQNGANEERQLEMTMHRGGSISLGPPRIGLPNGIINLNSNNNFDPGLNVPTPNRTRKSISFGPADTSEIESGHTLLHTKRKAASLKIKKLKVTYFSRNKGKRALSESSAQRGGSIALSTTTTSSSVSENEIVPEPGADVGDGNSLVVTESANMADLNGSFFQSYSPSSHRRSSGNIWAGMSFRTTRRSFTVARKLAKFAKEKKAAKTLGCVMGVFIICWLPFFVMNITFALCKSCAEGQVVLFEVATWLGWMNSAMNPVIYACWSQDFRRAFAGLLCCGRCAREALQRQRSSFV